MPWLAALVCCSAFDIALHDAFGNLNALPVYETYNSTFMHRDLASYLSPAEGTQVSFAGKYPADFFEALEQSSCGELRAAWGSTIPARYIWKAPVLAPNGLWPKNWPASARPN